MQPASTSEFIFSAIRASSPACVGGDRALDLLDDPVAHRRRRDQHLAVVGRPPVAGEEVEHLGDVGADVGVGGEEAEVGVEAGRLRVVVAGADVDVLAHPLALAAGDQDRLHVGLQAGDAVDDVDARLLQRLRPVDVGLLVEARFQLDHADRLLAAFGGADQRRHQRRVVAGPVDGLLDRQHVGVFDRLLDEALDRGGEGVVGMVDEQVGAGGSPANMSTGSLVLALQARLGDRRPGRVAQLGVAGDVGDRRRGRRGRSARRCRRPRGLRAAAPRPAARAASGSSRRRSPAARPRRSGGGAARPGPPAGGRRPRRRS